MGTSLNYRKTMEAGPGRRFLQQLAAKQELVIVVETCLFMSVTGKTFVGLNLLRHINYLLCSTAQIKKTNNYFTGK